MIKWTADFAFIASMSNQVVSLLCQVEDCIPEATGYQITASSADVAVMVNETVNATTFALQNVSSGDVYSVTIVPSNTLGFGMPTSTIFSKSLLQ